jgi:hypothetical protein
MGQTRTSSLEAARPLPPSADIGPGGQSVGQAFPNEIARQQTPNGIGGRIVWVVGLSPLANPAVWRRKLHACHCSPDIKIGIMQFSIFHRVPEVWVVDTVDHGADLLHDLRLVDHRPDRDNLSWCPRSLWQMGTSVRYRPSGAL